MGAIVPTASTSTKQELVSGAREPITPFIVKLPALAQHGVSCVLVIGGSGQYFDVAGEWAVCRPPRVTPFPHVAGAAVGLLPRPPGVNLTGPQRVSPPQCQPHELPLRHLSSTLPINARIRRWHGASALLTDATAGVRRTTHTPHTLRDCPDPCRHSHLHG